MLRLCESNKNNSRRHLVGRCEIRDGSGVEEEIKFERKKKKMFGENCCCRNTQREMNVIVNKNMKLKTGNQIQIIRVLGGLDVMQAVSVIKERTRNDVNELTGREMSD